MIVTLQTVYTAPLHCALWKRCGKCTWTTCFLHHHQSPVWNMEKRDTWLPSHNYCLTWTVKTKLHQSANTQHPDISVQKFTTHTLTQLVFCWALLVQQPRRWLGSHLPPYPDLCLVTLLITDTHRDSMLQDWQVISNWKQKVNYFHRGQISANVQKLALDSVQSLS